MIGRRSALACLANSRNLQYEVPVDLLAGVTVSIITLSRWRWLPCNRQRRCSKQGLITAIKSRRVHHFRVRRHRLCIGGPTGAFIDGAVWHPDPATAGPI